MEANCPLDKSIDSIKTPKFCHPESNRDSEATISRGDRGATSLGEEIHEAGKMIDRKFGVVHPRR